MSVSLSADGNVIAIGAPDNNNDNGIMSGRVRFYYMDDDSSSWLGVGRDIDGEEAYDELGYSVSLAADGKTVAIGAPDNDGNGEDSGNVRVFNVEY